jgi:glycosyltransferase involved in cell wall biosynthesis
MRILLIHQQFLEDDDPGGSRFNEMTKVWSDLNCQVTVIAGSMHYNLKKKREEYRHKIFVKKLQGNILVYRCFVSEYYNNNFIGRFWGYISFVLSSTFVGLFKIKNNFDVILVTSPPLFVGITARILSIFKKTPFVFEVRDLWPESAIDTGILNNSLLINLSYKLEKYLYKKAALINVLTPAFQQNLIDKKNIDPKKIIYIPNAADFNLSDTLVQNFDAISFRIRNNTDNKFVITYVGAHGVANHLIQVIDVAEKLRHTNIIFQLIGEGMQKSMLKEEVERRKLDNVIFIDAVPKYNVFEYILASDIGMSVLKKNDTFKTVFSNKTFDYMACKKPILMLIDGVSRELIEEAQCGIYAEPENISEIVEKIKVYYEDTNLLYLHGNNVYNFAKEKFDRIKLAKNYLDNLLAIK